MTRNPQRWLLSTIPLLAVILTLCSDQEAQADRDNDFGEALSQAALDRTSHHIRYDGRYFRIPYPNGDVPAGLGVCTDVIIRSYRTLGIDLQKEVHEDMLARFSTYPKNWGLKRTDSNIDHRRVPNLQTFFSNKGEALKVSSRPEDYKPGDLVTWMLNGKLPHIGIVVNRRSQDGERPLVVHNIGAGPQLEDILFKFPITGHYRFTGSPDRH